MTCKNVCEKRSTFSYHFYFILFYFFSFFLFFFSPFSHHTLSCSFLSFFAVIKSLKIKNFDWKDATSPKPKNVFYYPQRVWLAFSISLYVAFLCVLGCVTLTRCIPLIFLSLFSFFFLYFHFYFIFNVLLFDLYRCH
jgi:hypothetical protein